MVVCLEDAIRDDQVPQAVEGLSSLLMELAGKPSDLMIYVRPRNPRMLTQLLQLPNIDRVTGFVLPKVTTKTLPVWLNALMQSAHRIMPTIEGAEEFDRSDIWRLCEQLKHFWGPVSEVRL